MKEVLFIGGPWHGRFVNLHDHLRDLEVEDDEDRGELSRHWGGIRSMRKFCRAVYRIEEYAAVHPFKWKYERMNGIFGAHRFRGLFFGVIDGEFTPQECLIEYIRRCVPAAKREPTDAV